LLTVGPGEEVILSPGSIQFHIDQATIDALGGFGANFQIRTYVYNRGDSLDDHTPFWPISAL